MKVRAEILGIESAGDKLAVTLQGRQDRDAEWRPYLKFSFEVHDSHKTRKALHVGRIIRLEIEPQ